MKAIFCSFVRICHEVLLALRRLLSSKILRSIVHYIGPNAGINMLLPSSGQIASVSTYHTTQFHFPKNILHGNRIRSSHISRNTYIIFNQPSRIVLSLSTPIDAVETTSLKTIFIYVQCCFRKLH